MSDENLYLASLSPAISNELSFVANFILLNSHWNDSTDELNTAQKLRITSLPSTSIIVSDSAGVKFAETKGAKEHMLILSECIIGCNYSEKVHAMQ